MSRLAGAKLLMMTISMDRHEELRAGVFHLEGDIDAAVVPELRRELDSLIEAAFTNVVLDLKAVTYVDSSALGLLVWLDKRLQARGGRVVLAGASKDVLRIMEIAGLMSVTPTVTASANLEEALGGFELSRESAEALWNEVLSVPSRIEELSAVRERVCMLISPLHFSDAALFDIKVALGEALANAVRHGSRDGASTIAIRVVAYEDRVVVEVEDSGSGFSGEATCSDDLYASGGRGILFMRALMDRVCFSPNPAGGTIVTLTKHRTHSGRT